MSLVPTRPRIISHLCKWVKTTDDGPTQAEMAHKCSPSDDSGGVDVDHFCVSIMRMPDLARIVVLVPVQQVARLEAFHEPQKDPKAKVSTVLSIVDSSRWGVRDQDIKVAPAENAVEEQ